MANNCDPNYESVKQKILEARRMKCYDEMLILSEILISMCDMNEIEPIRFLAEAHFCTKFYERSVHLLNRHSELTHTDEHLMLIYTESLKNLGGEHINKALDFLQKVSPKWSTHPKFDPLKMLLGEIYEMSSSKQLALETYTQLFIIRPIYPKIIKKLFGLGVMTLDEEISLLQQTEFKKNDEWALHMARGLIESSRNINIQSFMAINLNSNENSKNLISYAPAILFNSPSRTIRYDELITKLREIYPITHLPEPLKFCNLSLYIQMIRAYSQSDYAFCFALGKMMSETLMANAKSILPLYLNSCVILGLSTEIRLIMNRLISEKAENTIICHTVGCFFLSNASYEKAILCFKKSIDASQTILDLTFYCSQISLGHALSLLSASHQAFRAYQFTSRIFKGDHFPYLFMGMELFKQGSYNEACTALLNADTICPDNPSILHELSIVYSKMKNYDYAIKAAEKTMDLVSSNQFLFSDIYLSNLGRIYFLKLIYLTPEDNHLFMKTLKLFRKVIEINFSNPEAHAYLGACYFLIGDQQASLYHLHWSKQFDQDNLIIHYFIQHIQKQHTFTHWKYNTHTHTQFLMEFDKINTNGVEFDMSDETSVLNIFPKLASFGLEGSTSPRFYNNDNKIEHFLTHFQSLFTHTHTFTHKEHIDHLILKASYQIEEAIGELEISDNS